MGSYPPGWSTTPPVSRGREGDPAKSRRIQVSGFDIVRMPTAVLVLEDNVRVPSGIAFAIENRRLMRRAFPELTGLVQLLDPEEAPALLRRTLEESTPPRTATGTSGDKPEIVLLGSGPEDSAYFEHRMLADAMNVPAVVSTDLLVEDDVVWYVTEKTRRRVDVVYLRMDDQLARRAGADRSQSSTPAGRRARRHVTLATH